MSLLSPGRGLRGVALSDAARSDGPGGWTVAAEVAAPGGAVAIGTAPCPPRPTAGSSGSTARPARIARLGEWLGVLWLTPAMDRLFVDTASARRRFLDRLVLALDPGHGGEVTRYDAAMRARTRLLTGEAARRPGLACRARAGDGRARRAGRPRPRGDGRRARRRARRRPAGDFPQAGIALAGERMPPTSPRRSRATAPPTPPPGAPPPARTAPT